MDSGSALLSLARSSHRAAVQIGEIDLAFGEVVDDVGVLSLKDELNVTLSFFSDKETMGRYCLTTFTVLQGKGQRMVLPGRKMLPGGERYYNKQQGGSREQNSRWDKG